MGYLLAFHYLIFSLIGKWVEGGRSDKTVSDVTGQVPVVRTHVGEEVDDERDTTITTGAGPDPGARRTTIETYTKRSVGVDHRELEWLRNTYKEAIRDR